MIIPIHDGIEGQNVSHHSLNYQSGTFETIAIDGLEEGEIYTFNAAAANMYGNSLRAMSISVLAGAISTTTPN